ncbi:MAG: NAD(P)-dependent oxidoreductase [Proteobacteria bacterium]|nr:NAD(P)-dependent oxidoreductase [Pseudomonadota bacterium]
MNVLVVGGLGFIGSHLVQKLKMLEHQVLVLDKIPTGYSLESHQSVSQALKSRRQNLLSDARIERGGPHDPLLFDRVLAKFEPDAIVYLVGMTLASIAEKHLAEARNSIFTYTSQALESLSRHPCIRRFVYISSSMIYGNFTQEFVTEDSATEPVNVYGAFKLASEILVKAYLPNIGIDHVIVRPTAVYGPYDIHRRVVQIFCEKALLGDPITLKVPSSWKLDFTYVDDLVEGLVATITHPKAANETFNMSFGRGRSFTELIEILQSHVPSLTVNIEVDDTKTVPKRGTLCNRKARDLIGFSPKFTLEAGISRYLSILQQGT